MGVSKIAPYSSDALAEARRMAEARGHTIRGRARRVPGGLSFMHKCSVCGHYVLALGPVMRGTWGTWEYSGPALSSPCRGR